MQDKDTPVSFQTGEVIQAEQAIKNTTGILCTMPFLTLVWISDRYCRKVMDFSSHKSAGIENAIVTDDHVRILQRY